MGLTASIARLAAATVERTLTSRVARPVWNRRAGAAVSLAGWLHRLDRRTDVRIDTTRAGRALLAAVPDAVERLRDEMVERCVIVSATNGKTTTANMLAAITRAAGQDTIVNDLGANMAGGICAELLAHLARSGRPAEVGIFEVDELWMDQLVDSLRPEVIILGNLLEDQVDRTGGPDRVAERWRRLVGSLAPATTLVANGDDPRLCWVVQGHPSAILVATGDGSHHDAGGPGTAVVARVLEQRGLDGVRFELSFRLGGEPLTERTVDMGIPGRHNVANALLAAGAAAAMGLEVDAIVDGLTRAPRVFGRVEPIDVDGRSVTLILAKNASGLDEVATMLAGDETGLVPPSPRRGAGLDLLFLLNDQPMDGTDVSWVHDARLDPLAPLVTTVTCGGSRSEVAATAFETAGVPTGQIFRSPGAAAAAALECALEVSSGELVAITNYSAMLDLRETLAELGHAERYWR